MTDETKQVSREMRGPQGRRYSRLSVCFLWLGLFWVVLVIVNRVAASGTASFFASWLGIGLMTVVIAVVGIAIWRNRHRLYRTLTSLPFSAALLTVILAATALGTVVLQDVPVEKFTHQYGAAFAPLFLFLGLDDMFHTVWFGGFLLLLAISLLLVPIKNKAWRVPMWGHLVSHLGIVMILFGGVIGYVWGFKGFIDLHEGQSVKAANKRERGRLTGEFHDLGFSLGLEDFEIERYPSEYRFYVYRKKGADFASIASYGLTEVDDWTSLGSDQLAFRMLHLFPDFYMRPELKEVPPGKGKPGLLIEMGQEEEMRRICLWAGLTSRDSADLSPEDPVVRFVWEPPNEQQVAGYTETKPDVHAITLQLDGHTAEQIVVQPHGTYTLASGKYELRILKYLPDFFYDMKTRQAGTRSQIPNNPALRVAIRKMNQGREQTRWLFAQAPDYGREHNHNKDSNGPHLTYHYTPAYEPALNEFLVVGKTREVWELKRGTVVRREPLDSWNAGPAKTSGPRFQVYASAEEVRVPATRSTEWNNPVAEILLREGSETRSARLSSDHSEPLRLADGRIVLLFSRKPDEVKAYRSRLAVYEEGNKVLEKTISVNDPLSYGGYSFYQSNYREDDPTYSGILVVKDPGLPLVWTGFGMLCFGMIFAYYVRPRLLRRGVT